MIEQPNQYNISPDRQQKDSSGLILSTTKADAFSLTKHAGILNTAAILVPRSAPRQAAQRCFVAALLLRNWKTSWLQAKSEFSGLAQQVANGPFTVLGFVVGSTGIYIVLPVLEDVIDDACKLVGGSYNRLR
jgi:hypothetical protein